MRRPISALAFTLLLSGLSSGPVLAASDPGEVEHKDGFGDAATAPLEDLNLKGKDLPPVLARARSAPYDLAGLDHCEAIAEEIGRLDGALGRDLDEAPPPDGRSRTEKLGSQAHSAAVAGVRSQSQGLLPFRSWVRKLTGAEARQHKLEAAIEAGRVRRGYLKGVGMRMNCAPPAAPSWFTPKTAQPIARAGLSLQALWLKLVAWFWSWWPF